LGKTKKNTLPVVAYLLLAKHTNTHTHTPYPIQTDASHLRLPRETGKSMATSQHTNKKDKEEEETTTPDSDLEWVQEYPHLNSVTYLCLNNNDHRRHLKQVHHMETRVRVTLTVLDVPGSGEWQVVGLSGQKRQDNFLEQWVPEGLRVNKNATKVSVQCIT
jgi:hypothetical protein